MKVQENGVELFLFFVLGKQFPLDSFRFTGKHFFDKTQNTGRVFVFVEKRFFRQPKTIEGNFRSYLVDRRFGNPQTSNPEAPLGFGELSLIHMHVLVKALQTLSLH